MNQQQQVKIPVCSSLDAELKNNKDIRFVEVFKIIQFLTDGSLRECYECIPTDKEIKPYFDLDIKRNGCPNEFQNLHDNKESLLTAHLDWLREHFENPTFAISSCHRADKISYHITITNYKTKMLELYKLSQTFKNHFDTSVYNKTMSACPRKFRTIFSKKGEETENFLMPETFKENNQLDQHFICNPVENVPFYTCAVVPEEPQQQQEGTQQQQEGTQQTLGDVMENSPLIDYKEWLRIGISLMVIYKDDRDTAYNEFLKFSKKHNSFNLNKFNKIWNDLLQRDYKIGGWNLIRKYVPLAYRRTHIKDIKLPIDANDYDIAQYIVETFEGFSITTCWANEVSANSRQWFIFKEHRWQKETECVLIKYLIHDHLYERYEKLIEQTRLTLDLETDEDQRKKIEEKVKSLKKVLSQIKSVKKCDTIMKCIFGHFHRAEFREKLDQNPYLLHFTNGVYDLNKAEFRNGEEEDYISLSTEYPYTPEYDADKMAELKSVLMQICCEREDLYECLITKLARHLKGDNSTKTQLFHCWYGRGSNGKSTLSNLLENVLGQYYARLPSSFLSQKMARSDGTSNDIAKLVGRRIVVMSETEENTPVNVATLKNFTGEKKVPYRPNFESVRETRITWTLLLLTNEKVQLPLTDYGTIRRFKYFPFGAKFVRDLEGCQDIENERKHYLMNEDINEKVDDGSFRNEFINLLLQHNNKELVFPDWLNETTLNMVKEQDKLSSILDGCVEEAPESYGLTWIELKNILKKDKLFHKLTYTSDHQLLDNVIERLSYVRRFKGHNAIQYTTTINGTEETRSSRSLLLCIRQKVDSEEVFNNNDECIF
jgi:phage/plasmid-associated DNA primase